MDRGPFVLKRNLRLPYAVKPFQDLFDLSRSSVGSDHALDPQDVLMLRLKGQRLGFSLPGLFRSRTAAQHDRKRREQDERNEEPIHGSDHPPKISQGHNGQASQNDTGKPTMGPGNPVQQPFLEVQSPPGSERQNRGYGEPEAILNHESRKPESTESDQSQDRRD